MGKIALPSPLLAFVLAWAVLALGGLGTAPQARADERAGGAWRVFQVTGEVRVRSDEAAGAWRTVAEGDGITAPAAIETGDRGRITLTRAGDVVHVLPRSALALPADDATGIVTEIVQTIGEAVFGVDKRPDRSFRVQTPHLVAVVKGTAFAVEVSETGASVSVSEGRVGVASVASGKGADVGAGQRATVSSDAAGEVSVGAASSAAATPNPQETEEVSKRKEKVAAMKAALKTGGRPVAGPDEDDDSGKSGKSKTSGSGKAGASAGTGADGDQSGPGNGASGNGASGNGKSKKGKGGD